MAETQPTGDDTQEIMPVSRQALFEPRSFPPEPAETGRPSGTLTIHAFLGTEKLGELPLRHLRIHFDEDGSVNSTYAAYWVCTA